MLNKKKRVNKSLFKSTLKNGVGYFSQNVSLKVVRGGVEGVKFGVSVSKKELKTAVKRNLLRRRVLSILGEVEVNKKPGLVCLFFLKKRALDLPYPQLQEEVVFLLKKAKVV